MAEPEVKLNRAGRRQGTRATQLEKEYRISQFVRMLSCGAVNTDLYRHASTEWGMSSRQADNYIKWAREALVADINLDRHIVVAEMLSVCRTVIKKALADGQYNCAVGAVNAIARIGGLEVK